MKLKLISTIMLSMFVLTASYAQKDKKERKSPPAEVSAKIGDATVTISYSQPAVKGREIFGDLVPFGKVWRTGANEATTFEVDRDIMINGKELPAGKYALFTIPGEKSWKIIFNSEAEQWGAYKRSGDKDVLDVDTKPQDHEPTERMTFSIKDGKVYLDWAETRVVFAIES